MTVKRYFAETAREALRRVKVELGPDAIVVSNRAVDGGVEIMAMSADSLNALSQQTPAAPAAPRAEALRPADPVRAAAAVEDDYTVSLSSKARSPFQTWQPAVQAAPPARQAAERPPLRPLPPRQEKAVPTSAQVAAAMQGAGGVDEYGEPAGAQVAQLMAEMKTIKAMLERQLAGFAWGEMSRQTPAKALLLSEMLEAGFSGVLARKLSDDMPSELSAEEGRKWLKNAVNRRLRTLTNETDIIDRGGVFAVVGPTGVGKTTTTAKLAARCVVRYGADRLALLTTDGYRIGAHEQLRIYGRILGVPVHIVRDSEDLRRTLADLRDKHMVLIDTVGMSQRDRMVAEQAAMLMRAGEVNRLLLLNATSRGDTLDDVIRAYAGENLAGCILTKVDEAASLAPALDAAVRHGLLLSYVANGQRVPEDLHLPNRNYLLHRAFKQPVAASPHRLREEEIGLVMAPSNIRPQGASLV
ncbi:MAG: flagellar biosynthesis protein FlhF [Rhodocyclales bacterium GWA2_65_20]|nr:MAG: flagellar biosynthesis protein FlhF [Rhodocyclales bacterium GWA2_65_20]